jgi:hypothetical protein
MAQNMINLPQNGKAGFPSNCYIATGRIVSALGFPPLIWLPAGGCRCFTALTSGFGLVVAVESR